LNYGGTTITKITCKCGANYINVGNVILCKVCDYEKYAWLVGKAYKKK